MNQKAKQEKERKQLFNLNSVVLTYKMLRAENGSLDWDWLWLVVQIGDKATCHLDLTAPIMLQSPQYIFILCKSRGKTQPRKWKTVTGNEGTGLHPSKHNFSTDLHPQISYTSALLIAQQTSYLFALNTANLSLIPNTLYGFPSLPGIIPEQSQECL